jgi:hypothetical protein
MLDSDLVRSKSSKRVLCESENDDRVGGTEEGSRSEVACQTNIREEETAIGIQEGVDVAVEMLDADCC